MAQVLEVDAQQDFMGLVARGSRRFTVSSWVSEDAYPQAELELLPEFAWDEALQPLRVTAEESVRRALVVGSEFGSSWPADVRLADDPVAACWQLAAITPVGAIDQIAMLQSASLEELLSRTSELAAEAVDTISMGWPDAPDP